SVPTSAVLKANELGTDFPNRILSSAKAARDDRIRGAARVPATTLRLDTTLRLERVRIVWSPELRAALLPTALPFSRSLARLASRLGTIGSADVGIAIHRHRLLTKSIKIFQSFFVTHVFRHVVGFAMDHVVKRTAHAWLRWNIGIADRHDQVEGEQRRHAQHLLKRLLDVNCIVLAAKPECGGREMHHHGGVGEPISE